MAQNTLINKRATPGFCQLRGPRCEGQVSRLEWHHESYEPNPRQARKDDRGLWLCHACHFTIHFKPQLLSRANKETLIYARLGKEGRVQAAKGEIDVASLIDSYTPPRRE